MERSEGMPPGREDSDDVVLDVADALSLNQRVEWERCEKLVTPANRRALDNLRALARVFSGDQAAADASPADDAATRVRAFWGRAAQALIAVAVAEVAATLVVLPWAWSDYHRVHGELAVYEAIKLVALATAAFLLLTAGRREPRTWLLGVYCLLKATLPPLHMLPAFFLEIAPPEQFTAFAQALPASSRLFLYLYVPSYLFAPAFLWAFARECPRVHRRARLDDLARRMVPVSVAIGFALWVGTPATVQLAQAGYEVPVSLLFDASIATLHVLALAAVVIVALRAHTAPAAEVRRVAVFAAGFLMHTGVSAAYDDAGCLHGDVKRSNIGFTESGFPKLLDFGLARGADDGGAIAGGTLRYASPEVLAGRPADEADDVWSLCVVLYEMVTAEHPFADGGVGEVTRRIRRRRVGHRGGSAACRPMSPAAAFAASVLAASRRVRPATAAAFAEALRAVVGDGA